MKNASKWLIICLAFLSHSFLHAAPLAPEVQKDLLDAHNRVRAGVKTKPLTWSPKLAAFAQAWAEHLAKNKNFALEHRSNNDYGENLFSANNSQATASGVVNSWSRESKDFDYASNSCNDGKMCGHYTQIVWRTSTEVGCGMVKDAGKEVWVCNYNPPGNWEGEKPY